MIRLARLNAFMAIVVLFAGMPACFAHDLWQWPLTYRHHCHPPCQGLGPGWGYHPTCWRLWPPDAPCCPSPALHFSADGTALPVNPAVEIELVPHNEVIEPKNQPSPKSTTPVRPPVSKSSMRSPSQRGPLSRAGQKALAELGRRACEQPTK